MTRALLIARQIELHRLLTVKVGVSTSQPASMVATLLRQRPLHAVGITQWPMASAAL